MVPWLEGTGYYGEHDYDDAIADSTNHNAGTTEENSLRLNTINNPYYGGNDYISLHYNDKPENGDRQKVDTLKIVDNVYYEWNLFNNPSISRITSLWRQNDTLILIYF